MCVFLNCVAENRRSYHLGTFIGGTFDEATSGFGKRDINNGSERVEERLSSSKSQ